MNVALKIDAQKEEVIGQLRQAWTQMVEHWKELEHQRQELAHMLEQERVEARNAKTNLSQVCIIFNSENPYNLTVCFSAANFFNY